MYFSSIYKKVMNFFIHSHQGYVGYFQTSKQKVMSGNRHRLWLPRPYDL
jgi:hypothetical protein